MQTKKRAKPVKFGLKAKEAEQKEQQKSEVTPLESHHVEKVEESAPEEKSVQPAEAEVASASEEQGELVSKLSDVPFETDFGSPAEEEEKSSEPTTFEQPEASFSATPTIASSIEPEQTSETVSSPEAIEPVKPEPVTSQPVQSLSSPEDVTPVTTIPPIGRANEPIPFSAHDTVFNTPPEASEKRRNPFIYFLIVAFVAFVTGIAFMAGLYYAMPNKNLYAMFLHMPSMPSVPGITKPSPTPSPIPATPTVAPTEKLSDYSITVLNGSGVTGLAAKVKASLETEGFTVANTGNADSSDVEKTQIVYKKTVSQSALDKVKALLSKSYVLDKETVATADNDKTPDITITIGKQTAQ